MCDCINNTDPTWEVESQQIFKAMAEGKFPLNKRIKDAFDAIVKIAKSGNAPPPAIVVTTSSNTITDEALVGRLISMMVIGDTNKTTGFAKTGADDAAKLASDTVVISEGVMEAGTVVVIIFK